MKTFSIKTVLATFLVCAGLLAGSGAAVAAPASANATSAPPAQLAATVYWMPWDYNNITSYQNCMSRINYLARVYPGTQFDCEYQGNNTWWVMSKDCGGGSGGFSGDSGNFSVKPELYGTPTTCFSGDSGNF